VFAAFAATGEPTVGDRGALGLNRSAAKLNAACIANRLALTSIEHGCRHHSLGFVLARGKGLGRISGTGIIALLGFARDAEHQDEPRKQKR
jgi:hypothetical protein